MKSEAIPEIPTKVTIENIYRCCNGMYFPEDFLIYKQLDILKELPDYLCWDFSGIVFMAEGSICLKINGKDVKVRYNELLIIRKGDFWSDLNMESEDCQGWLYCYKTSVLLNEESYKKYGHLSMALFENNTFQVNDTLRKIIERYGEIIELKYEGGYKNIRVTLASLSSDILSSIILSAHGNDAAISPAKVFQMFTVLLSGIHPKNREVRYYAEQLSVSPKHLTTITKRISGKTASEWIAEAVMSEIKRQLTYTNLSVKEIALELGFSNTAFFSKYVKQHSGKTALELRATLRR